MSDFWNVNDALLGRVIKFIVFLLPMTAALGPLFMPINIGINMFGFRVLILILFFVYMASYKKLVLYKSRTFMWLNAYLFSSLLFGVVNVFTERDYLATFSDLATFLLAALLIASLNGLHYKDKSLFNVLLQGWGFAFFIELLIVVWELKTGNHLYQMYGDSWGPNIPRGSFNNSNDFGGFLMLSFPFLLLLFLQLKHRVRFVLLLGLLLHPLLLLLTASRVSVLGGGLQYLFLLTICFKQYKKSIVFFLAMFILFFMYSVANMKAEDVKILSKINSINREITKGSIRSRINLAKNGWWMFVESYGVGVGAGNFEHYMIHKSPPFFVGNSVPNPHNLPIEILAEYGVVTLLLFIGFYFSMLTGYLRDRYKVSPYKLFSNKNRTVMLALIGYFFAFFVSSSLIKPSYHWIFVATLILLIHEKYLYEVKDEQN